MQRSDAELIRAIGRGDTAAWEELVDRHLPCVWRYAFSKCQNSHLAEDIASETMMALVHEVGRKRGLSFNLSAWLIRVAGNKTVDYVRKTKRDKTGLADIQQCSESRDEILSVADDAVSNTLDAMDATERLVLEWKYFDALSVREIAMRMGKTEKAVTSLLYRSRNSFRRIYGQQAGNLGRFKGVQK